LLKKKKKKKKRKKKEKSTCSGKVSSYRREVGIQPKCRERRTFARRSARDDRNWPFMPPRGKYTVLCSLSEGFASAESFHRAAFTSFTDSNFRPTKERFTDALNLISAWDDIPDAFQTRPNRASTVLAERGFYAALSRANEMNVQSANAPSRLNGQPSKEKERKERGEKEKNVSHARCLTSLPALPSSLLLLEDVQFSLRESGN